MFKTVKKIKLFQVNQSNQYLHVHMQTVRSKRHSPQPGHINAKLKRATKKNKTFELKIKHQNIPDEILTKIDNIKNMICPKFCYG